MIENPRPVPAKLERRIERRENEEVQYKSWCCGHPGCSEELARVVEERQPLTRHLNRDGTTNVTSPARLRKSVKLADGFLVLRSSPHEKSAKAGKLEIPGNVPDPGSVPEDLKRYFTANQTAHKQNVSAQKRNGVADEQEVKLSRIDYKKVDYSFGEEWFKDSYLVIWCPLHRVANIVKSVE